MELIPETYTGEHIIRSYEPGKLQIGTQLFTTPLILTPKEILHPWLIPDPNAMTLTTIQPLLDLAPQLVLLGLGEHYQYPAIGLLAEFLKRGIGIEVMSTQAACRTYNLLASEVRLVAAALLV